MGVCCTEETKRYEGGARMYKAIIVENDPMVAMIIQQFIERYGGFQVIASVRNINALRGILEKNVPDLILLDAHLPGETGIEFLQDLRQDQISVAIIIITALHDIGTIKKALELGVIDFLIKPFTYERFEMAINHFIQYHSFTTDVERANQETLDQIIIRNSGMPSFNSDERDIASVLPKGVSKITLKRILKATMEQNYYFSTEDIAKEVKLSRISTKKYLQFLHSLGYLKTEMKYSAVGRPTTVFRLVPEKEYLVAPFK